MKKAKTFFIAFILFFITTVVLAGSVFYSSALIYINDNGTKSVGDNSTQNTSARALTYRNGIEGESSYTNANPPIYGGPAYTSDEVGSSIWQTVAVPGQEMYIVTETFKGLNDWQGVPYVGGAHQTLTESIISNLGMDENDPFPDVVLEEITTPIEETHTATTITLKWTGLYDRTDIYPSGEWNDSIVSYNVYRSANDTSNPQKIGMVAQAPGEVINFVDENVSQGVNYFYQLSVNFRWESNVPSPWYETEARSEWSSAIYTSEPANAIKFIDGNISAMSGEIAGPITVSSYNVGDGDIINLSQDLQIGLSSSSSGDYYFYEYDNNICTENKITNAVILSGTNSISFCYSDTEQGEPIVNATPANEWDTIFQNQTILAGYLDHFEVSFISPQINNEYFTGTNLITAKDLGGNTITDYNSPEKWIGATISSSKGELESYDLISTDFVDGVASLSNFKYIGSAEAIDFTVTSNNGKTGQAQVTILPGEINYIKIIDNSNGIESEIEDYNLSVDNVLDLYSAGYDISGNYIPVTGNWVLLTGDLIFSGGDSHIILDPSVAEKSGVFEFCNNDLCDQTGLVTTTHGALNHFIFSENINDNTAGELFDIGTITALDAEENIVKSFNEKAVLSDTSETIFPQETDNFLEGVLQSQDVYITKAGSTSISVSFNGKINETNSFNVFNNVLDHFSFNFSPSQINNYLFENSNTITAQDEWNNPILDFDATEDNVIISSETGQISGLGSAANNVLNQSSDFVNGVAELSQKIKYLGTSGGIVIEAVSSTTNKSGEISINIDAGDLVRVVLRESPNGEGDVTSDHLMKVGETYNLYSAGYDISNNYISDINGLWTKSGLIDAPSTENTNHLIYEPLTAETSGQIVFNDQNGHLAQSKNIIVKRGDLDHFSLLFEHSQINGESFTGINNLIAQDIGNNIITDYNSIGENVILSSENAEILNSVFAPSNFINGVVNLTNKELKYIGPIGNVLITATSQISQKQGQGSVEITIGALHHFAFDFESEQDNEQVFQGINTITAEDIGNNTIKNFNALVDNITITVFPNVGEITGLGSLNNNVLDQSSDFVDGVADLTNKLIYDGVEGGYVFNAISQTEKTGSSERVEISVGPLDHFLIYHIPNQIAGQEFEIGIVACDIVGNIKTSFNDYVNISDSTGTIIPTQTPDFIGGEISLNMIITKAMNGVVITINKDNIISNSSAFHVASGELDHFSFSENISNQTAGQSFILGDLLAQDEWGNTVALFNESVNMSDSTGTITPTQTNNFVSGILENQEVIITKAVDDITIQIDSGLQQGVSNSFSINPNLLSYINIEDSETSQGNIVEDYTLTTDDHVIFYANGYDEYGNFISNILGNWQVSGDLDLSEQSNYYIDLNPSVSNTQGIIMFDDQNGHTGVTGTINVLNGRLNRFVFDISRNQTVGNALVENALITALDMDGNNVINFDASENNVTITSDNNATILGLGYDDSNTFNQSSDFVNGVANLNLVYAGTAGDVIFIATSSDLKTSNSNTVSFSRGGLDHFDVNFYEIQKNAQVFTGENNIIAKDLGGNTIDDFNETFDGFTTSIEPENGILEIIETFNFINGIADLNGKIKYIGSSGLHTFSIESPENKIGISGLMDILPGEIDYIKIINSGGENINDLSLNAGDNLEAWAVGYDVSNNFVRYVPCSWVGLGVLSGNISSNKGRRTIVSAAEMGTGKLYARFRDFSDITGTITVLSGEPNKLVFFTDPYDGEYNNISEYTHSNNAPIIQGDISPKITLNLNDVTGNLTGANQELTILTSSTSSTAEFSLDGIDWQDAQTINFFIGQNSVDFYYRDINPGNYIITASVINSEISSVSQNIKIVSKKEVNLIFTTLERVVNAGEVSEQISIQVQDNEGNPIPIDEDIIINLESNSLGENHFYADSEGIFEISTIDILAGEDGIGFYYKDNLANKSLIKVFSDNITEAYQFVNVRPSNNRNIFIVPGLQGVEIIENELSQPILLKIKDEFNNLVFLENDLNISLQSENETGSFFTGEYGEILTIQAGKSKAVFYYIDSTLGDVQVTALSDGLQNGSQIETIIPALYEIFKLDFANQLRNVNTNTSSQVITIQTQDVQGNPVLTEEDRNISLFTNASTGSFALTPAGPWNITSVTIGSGEYEANFYYKDSFPGTKTIGVSENPSLGWEDAIQEILINSSPVSQINFTSELQSIFSNQSSELITFRLEDAQGNPTLYNEDIEVLISSNSETGEFSLNGSDWGIGSVLLPAGNNSIGFYYRDTTTGTHVLSIEVLDHDWQYSSHNISIYLSPVSQITFTSGIQSILLNQKSELITVETRDENGNMRNVDSDTIIELDSNSDTGNFEDINGNKITSITVPINEHEASFYYKDTSVGIFSICIAEKPEKGWTNAIQQIAVGQLENEINKVVFKTESQTMEAGETSSLIEIESQSIIGRAISTGEATEILISSDSPTGMFAKTLSGSWQKDIILTLEKGTSLTSFYYRDSSAGEFSIISSVSPEKDWLGDLYNITVEPAESSKIVFITPSQSIVRNLPSSLISIQLQDSFGNIKNTNQDIQINLSSSYQSGQFSLDNNLWEEINSVNINTGFNSASFYYKDSSDGSPVISVSKDGFDGFSQTFIVTEPILDYIVILPEIGTVKANSNIQYTALAYNSFDTLIPDISFQWEVLDSNIGTIDNNGLFTAKSSTGSFENKIKVSINEKEAFASVEIFTQTKDTQIVTSSNIAPAIIYKTLEVPINASLIINNAEKETLERKVSLSIYATGASYMKISNTVDFSNSTSWIKYQNSYEWEVTENKDENKIVYIKFKNNGGGESAVAHDSIRYVSKLSEPIISTTTEVKSVVYNNYIIVADSMQNQTSNEIPQIISPTSGGIVFDDSIYITGHAKPNTLLSLNIKNQENLKTKIITNNSGKFVYKMDKKFFAPGKYAVYASMEKDNGEVLVGSTTTFEVISSEHISLNQKNLNDDFILISEVYNNVIGTGDYLDIVVFIKNNSGENKDVILNYIVRDGLKEILFTDSEIVKIKKEKQLNRAIRLPKDMSLGKYVVEISLNYDDEVLGSSNFFEIKNIPKSVDYFSIFYFTAFGALLIFIVFGVKKLLSILGISNIADLKNKIFKK